MLVKCQLKVESQPDPGRFFVNQESVASRTTPSPPQLGFGINHCADCVHLLVQFRRSGTYPERKRKVLPRQNPNRRL